MVGKQKCVFVLIKKKFVCGGQEGSLAEHSPGILEVLGELSSTMSKTKHNRSRNK